VFPLETVAKNYTEGGVFFEYEGFPGTLYNRSPALFLLDGGTVTVEAGQQARLYYVLTLTVSPTVQTVTWPTASYDSAAPGGWDDASGQQLVLSASALDGLTADGALLMPSRVTTGYLSTQATLYTYGASNPPTWGGAIGAGVQATLSPYVAGSFYRDRTWTFPSTHSNTTAIRSFLLAGNWGAFQFLFDSAKTKTNLHALSLPLRTSITRVLTNP
jgi:hypothetical protein